MLEKSYSQNWHKCQTAICLTVSSSQHALVFVLLTFFGRRHVRMLIHNFITTEMFVRTVLPAKNDSDVMFTLHLLSKTLTCTIHLS